MDTESIQDIDTFSLLLVCNCFVYTSYYTRTYLHKYVIK